MPDDAEGRRARVVELLKQGMSGHGIAETLGVSERTVRRDKDEALAAGELDASELPEYVERRGGGIYPASRAAPPAEMTPQHNVNWAQESREAKAAALGVAPERLQTVTPLQQQLGASGYASYLEELDAQRARDREARRALALERWKLTPLPRSPLSALEVLRRFVSYLFPPGQRRTWPFTVMSIWALNRALAVLGLQLIGHPPLSDRDEASAQTVEVSPGRFATFASFELIETAPMADGDGLEGLRAPEVLYGLVRHLSSAGSRLPGVGVLPVYDMNATLVPFGVHLVGQRTMLGIAPRSLAMTRPGYVESFVLYRLQGVNYTVAPPEEADEAC